MKIVWEVVFKICNRITFLRRVLPVSGNVWTTNINSNSTSVNIIKILLTIIHKLFVSKLRAATRNIIRVRFQWIFNGVGLRRKFV